MTVVWSCGDDETISAAFGPANSSAGLVITPLCPYKTAISGLPLLLSIFTTLGNLLVLSVIFSSSKLRKKETNILIVNLSLADLMVGSMVTPLAVTTLATDGRWLFGRLLCRVWISLDVICCTASIATLCAISIDRLIGVVRPMHYKTIVTAKRIIIACSCIWIFSLSVLLATIRWVSLVDSSGGDMSLLGLQYGVCQVGMELKYVIHSIILSFFIPLAVILAVYFKIYRVVHKRETGLVASMLFQANNNTSCTPEPPVSNSKKNSREEQQHITVLDDNAAPAPLRHRMSMFPLRIHYGGNATNIDKQHKFFSKQKKSATMLSKVVGAFFLCWFPFFLLYMIHHLCECIPGPVLELFTWFGYMNSGLNPIIYALTIRGIGARIKDKLGNKLTRQSCCTGVCVRERGRPANNRRVTSDEDDRESIHSLEPSFGLHIVRRSMRMPKSLRTFKERRRHHTLRMKTSGGSNADCGYWSQEGSRYSGLHNIEENFVLQNTAVSTVTAAKQTIQIPNSTSWMTGKLYSMLISTQCTTV